MKKCPRCGAENPDDANFCQVCYYPLNEGVKFELPKSFRIEEERPHVNFSRNMLIASLAVNAAYHILLSAMFIAIVTSLIISEVNQTVVAALPLKYFDFLALATLIEFVSVAIAFFAFKSNKRVLLYVLYPIGLIGMFYSLTINPQVDFGFFSLVYYPSSLMIIVGGSYFAVLLREALYEDRMVKWATLALMVYYFALVLMPGLISILSIINFVSSILIIYSLVERGGVKIGERK